MKIYRSFCLYVVLFCLSILSADVCSAATYCKFYEHADRKGAYLEGELENMSYLGDSWNDKISSVWVGNGYTVTIYEHAHFDGKSQILHGKPGGAAYNLTDTNFNDMTSSYKISKSSEAGRSTKDICCKFYEHANRKGEHLKGELEDRSYVGDRWNDKISSVWVRNGYTVTIYEHAHLEGKNQMLHGKPGGAVYNLTDTNFNDMTSSYKVRKGGYDDSGEITGDNLCRFYEHADSKGAHLEGEPGNRDYVGDRWNDKISSVWVGNGYTVIIYENAHFGGKSQTLLGKPGGTVYNLTDMNFNDMASSYKIKKGRYDDSDRRADDSGRRADDSGRRADDSGRRADDSGRMSGDNFCRFYEQANRRGAHLKGVPGNRSYVGDRWNDKISSVWVGSGYTVTIYEKPRFGGKSQVLQGKPGGASYNLAGMNFNDMVSSYKIRKGGA
ncbi:peptidase inhibitor family I36 protein, partial [Desulfobacterales bacterium HSG2]|nr:peptidase inhibitor family I36 protein [Desulfobacterales bacterium HSG2]